jgi:hypothetical protein
MVKVFLLGLDQSLKGEQFDFALVAQLAEEAGMAKQQALLHLFDVINSSPLKTMPFRLSVGGHGLESLMPLSFYFRTSAKLCEAKDHLY